MNLKKTIMFCFSGWVFLSSPQNNTSILMWEHKGMHLIYIVYNIEFKDKTYGFNF
jgi:hypothetical protein